MLLGQLPLRKLPPTPKLTLTQTLALSRGQFFTGAIVWFPPTLRLTLTLTKTPILTRGGGGANVRIPQTIKQWKYCWFLEFFIIFGLLIVKIYISFLFWKKNMTGFWHLILFIFLNEPRTSQFQILISAGGSY